MGLADRFIFRTSSKMVMETPSVGVAAPNELRECTAGDVKNMNMDKQVATRLFRMLAVNEKTVSSIKRDHASYAKLSLLTQQVGLLQQQAQTVVDKCEAKVAKQARIEEADADPIADISEAPPVKGTANSVGFGWLRASLEMLTRTPG